MGEGSASDGARPLAPCWSWPTSSSRPELQQRCDGFLDPLLPAPVADRPQGARAPRPARCGAGPPPPGRAAGRKARPTSTCSTPTSSASGWQSPHTVVQIVTDDMPFLVDSVRMVMTAMGLGIHLVIHPMLRVVREERSLRRAARRARPTRRGSTSRSTGATVCGRRRCGSGCSPPSTTCGWRWPTGGPCATAVDQLAHELEHTRAPAGRPGRRARAAQFLRWLSDDHLVFLGYREYDFLPAPTAVRTAEEIAAVSLVPGSASSATAGGPKTLTTSRRSRPRRGGWCSRPRC